MKKTILTFVAFTAITITNAQDKPKLFFGAKVGANISTLVGFFSKGK